MRLLKTKIFVTLLFLCLIMGVTAPTIVKADGPPSQEDVFLDINSQTHTFSDNYWDIMVYNNENWEVEDPEKGINNMTTWLNNTWNIKWISEGNFEMGFLAFMNKSGDEQSSDNKYYTPAQFWWMHYYYEGHEMLIGNMLTAWYGFRDTIDNDVWDEDVEELTPFFYMTMDKPAEVNNVVFPGLAMNTNVEVTPIQRNEVGSVITYTWAYNYTEIGFWVPKVNHTDNNNTFEWGFEYNDPGTYIDGSSAFGVQEFIYYSYTLEINENTKRATLSYNYIGGEISQLFTRDNQGDPWVLTGPEDPNYMPRDWALCIGDWSFIMAGRDEDYVLSDSDGSSINTTTTNTGLTSVSANVMGLNVFNFDFNRKPEYSIYELGDPSNVTTDSVEYQALGIEENEVFLNLVSGMTQLIGPFGRLLCAYAINQTNHFINGITFDEAWENFDPNNRAALFVSCYPLFGEYKGGRLEHDPTFIANFTPGDSWGLGGGISGYSSSILLITLTLGIVTIICKKKNQVTRIL